MGRGPSSHRRGAQLGLSHAAQDGPRKMTEERISRISASGTSQPVGAEASTTASPAARPAAQVPEDVQGGRQRRTAPGSCG